MVSKRKGKESLPFPGSPTPPFALQYISAIHFRLQFLPVCDAEELELQRQVQRSNCFPVYRFFPGSNMP